MLDTAWVLQAIHAFFQGIGPEEVRKRSAREDKPLRMVKTVLHELCKLKVSLEKLATKVCTPPQCLLVSVTSRDLDTQLFISTYL